jgi:hypothetical protein
VKTAIYIEDGVVQLVLTPEGKFEKNALAAFENKPTETRIMHGEFYDCAGGWARHSRPMAHGVTGAASRSLIIRTEAGQKSEQDV